MRNTRIYIIISVVVLIIVGIIASILSNQLKKGGQSNSTEQNAEKVETTGTRSLSRTEQYREATRITKQAHTILLSDDQVKRFDNLCSDIQKSQNNIVSSESFDISCSKTINLFCVQKKTPEGSVEFEKYLTEKNALDIYKKDPSLFVTADENCSTYLKKQEELLVQDLELYGETFPKDKEISYDEIKKQNQEKNLEVLKKLATSLFSPSTAGVDSLESYLFDNEEINQLASQSAFGSQGIINPPNIESANSEGYYKMPQAPNGEYTFGGWNFCGAHSYGSKELIGAIYTAALKWKAKYPQYTFRIGDLNGRKVPAYQGHSSHGNGVDVDIVTYGNWNLQINAPVEVNIDLGKAFIDTGITKLIIIGGKVFNKNAPIVQNALKEYANSKGLPFQTYGIGNHDNHFHIRINDQFRLNEYRPKSPC